MKKNPQPPPPVGVVTAATARRELKKRLDADASQRAKAHGILHPDVVAEGKVRAARLLTTTLGGQTRPITREDLAKFAASAKRLGAEFEGGITVPEVVALSLEADRTRAREEIHTCYPVSNRGAVVQFQTNAGPLSQVKRHQVLIQFVTYSQAVSVPEKKIKASIKRLVEGPIKLECDCQRWRFFFRYVATIGNYNAGRPETGYPKIRNPELVGVACKHILRVMMIVRGPTFEGFAKRMIERGRAQVRVRNNDVPAIEARQFVQAVAAEPQKSRTLQSKSIAKLKAAAQAHIATMDKPTGMRARQNIRYLRNLGVLSPAQADQAMQRIKGV